ncbi:hypothetical protein CJ030_MR2G016965 [Morella rubra]|uniref:Uncharacterized protein n=1 Tax=Morella rubra TaxID=262757 RepID=A0A6A1WIJ6_9ROSI|nr:hypothetical protein CJ030_MR2G016965 [Morella rubra]
MGCSKPAESLPASKPKKAIEEIIKGRQLANQLRSLLNDSHGDDVLAPAKDLILKVLSSFTNSLTILSSDDVSQLQANTHGHKSKSSKGSCRNDISTIKDRRGRYKRSVSPMFPSSQVSITVICFSHGNVRIVELLHVTGCYVTARDTYSGSSF